MSLDDFTNQTDHPFTYVNKKRFVTLTGNHENNMPVDCVKVASCILQESSKTLAIGCNNGQVLIYLIPEINLIKSYSMDKMERSITCLSMPNSKDILCVANEHSGEIIVFNWKLGNYLLEVNCDDENSTGCSCVAFSPDGLFLATCSEKSFNIRYWLAHSGKSVAKLTGHTAGVKGLVFVPNKPNILLSSSLDGTIRAFDLKKYRNFRTLSVPSRQVQLSHLAVDQTGSLVMASAGEFSGLFEGFIWSLDSSLLLTTITNHTGPISGLGFLPLAKKSDGSLVLYTSSWDGFLRLWSLGECQDTTNQSTVNMLTMTDSINCQHDIICTSISPTSNKAALGLVNSQILIVDLDTSREVTFIDGHYDLGVSAKADQSDVISANRIAKTEQHFLALQYSSNGNLLLAGGHGKYICLYSSDDGILVKRFPTTVNFSLTGVQDVFDRHCFIPTIPLSAHSDTRNSMDLPGVPAGDKFSKRWWRPTAKTTSIAFSPCGDEFLASTSDSIVMFSLKSSISAVNRNTRFFDITSGGGLTPSDTPANCLRLILRKEKYAEALVMALKLNDQILIRKCLEYIPMDKAEYLTTQIPFNLLTTCLVPFIADELMSIAAKVNFSTTNEVINVHLGLYVILFLALVKQHALALRTYYHTTKVAESLLERSSDPNDLTASLIKLSSAFRLIKENLVSISDKLDAGLDFITITHEN